VSESVWELVDLSQWLGRDSGVGMMMMMLLLLLMRLGDESV